MSRNKTRKPPTHRPDWRNRAEYVAYLKAHPEERQCGCGKPAAQYKQGYFCCDDCADIHAKDTENRIKIRNTPKKRNDTGPTKTHTEMRYDGDLEGFAKPPGKGWGCEDQLEAMLNALPPLPTRKAA